MFKARNGCVKLPDMEMDFISFGSGNKNLIMIPGLGDGLKTVKGLALPFAFMYRCYASKYKVYVFSRKNNMSADESTRRMAADLKAAMDYLNIDKADVVGISQGGMIAQYLAIDAAEKVNRLVLAVTAAKPNETMQPVIREWIRLAENDDYRTIFIDTAEKSYTEKYLKAYRFAYPILSRIGKPKDFNRYIIQARACLTHNCEAELNQIHCPVFIIGGDQDKIVGSKASSELADKISGSKLLLYKGLGHGLYDEAADFNEQILAFLNQNDIEKP